MVRAAAQTKREVGPYFHCRRPRSTTLNNILPPCSMLSHSILFWAHATVNTMVSVLLRPIWGLITFARLYIRSSLTWIVVRANMSLVFDIYLHTRAAHWRLWGCKDWNNILNWNEVVGHTVDGPLYILYIPQLPVNQGRSRCTRHYW